MIQRHRQHFASLGRREIELCWLALQKYRGLQPGPCPWFDGEKFFDDLHEAGVYTAELAAALLVDPRNRDLLRKIVGADV